MDGRNAQPPRRLADVCAVQMAPASDNNAKESAASGGNSEPKQGQRSQSARGFCPRCTMRVPQPYIIEHFGNADAVPQPPERCLSRKAGIVRCCPCLLYTSVCQQPRAQHHLGVAAQRPDPPFPLRMAHRRLAAGAVRGAGHPVSVGDVYKRQIWWMPLLRAASAPC